MQLTHFTKYECLGEGSPGLQGPPGNSQDSIDLLIHFKVNPESAFVKTST